MKNGTENTPKKMDYLVFIGTMGLAFLAVFIQELYCYLILGIATVLGGIYSHKRRPALFKTKDGKDKSTQVFLVVCILAVLAAIVNIFLNQ